MDVRSARLYGQFSLDKMLTLQAGSTVFGFGRIFGSNIRQNIMPKQGFGRTLAGKVHKKIEA